MIDPIALNDPPSFAYMAMQTLLNPHRPESDRIEAVHDLLILATTNPDCLIAVKDAMDEKRLFELRKSRDCPVLAAEVRSFCDGVNRQFDQALNVSLASALDVSISEEQITGLNEINRAMGISLFWNVQHRHEQEVQAVLAVSAEQSKMYVVNLFNRKNIEAANQTLDPDETDSSGKSRIYRISIGGSQLLKFTDEIKDSLLEFLRVNTVRNELNKSSAAIFSGNWVWNKADNSLQDYLSLYSDQSEALNVYSGALNKAGIRHDLEKNDFATTAIRIPSSYFSTITPENAEALTSLCIADNNQVAHYNLNQEFGPGAQKTQPSKPGPG